MSTLAVFRELSGVMNTDTLEISLSRAKDIAERLAKEIPPPKGTTPTPVAQYEVRSLVMYTDGSKTPSSTYLAPSKPAQMAHWTVLIGDLNKNPKPKYFHLVLDDTKDKQDGKVDGLEVSWDVRTWHKGDDFQGHRVKLLGHTKYGLTELDVIGDRMVQEFGDYHAVFWNCQMFAKCYLRVILEKDDVWDQWTSGDVASFFLVALVLTGPLALTSWYKKRENEKRIINAGRAAALSGRPVEDLTIREQSEYIIRHLYDQGLSDAEQAEWERAQKENGGDIVKMIGKMIGMFRRS